MWDIVDAVIASKGQEEANVIPKTIDSAMWAETIAVDGEPPKAKSRKAI
jgi:hypothetical protein